MLLTVSSNLIHRFNIIYIDRKYTISSGFKRYRGYYLGKLSNGNYGCTFRSSFSSEDKYLWQFRKTGNGLWYIENARGKLAVYSGRGGWGVVNSGHEERRDQKFKIRDLGGNLALIKSADGRKLAMNGPNRCSFGWWTTNYDQG